MSKTKSPAGLLTVHETPYDICELKDDLGNFMSKEALGSFFASDAPILVSENDKVIGEIKFVSYIE